MVMILAKHLQINSTRKTKMIMNLMVFLKMEINKISLSKIVIYHCVKHDQHKLVNLSKINFQLITNSKLIVGDLGIISEEIKTINIRVSLLGTMMTKKKRIYHFLITNGQKSQMITMKLETINLHGVNQMIILKQTKKEHKIPLKVLMKEEECGFVKDLHMKTSLSKDNVNNAMN